MRFEFIIRKNNFKIIYIIIMEKIKKIKKKKKK
jgi:hypothetical protein